MIDDDFVVLGHPGIYFDAVRPKLPYLGECGAYGPSYFALIATGRNTYYTHYHKNTALLQDGDLVQIDYAPDYKYYQSDITRVFPANGKFSPRQREYYQISLKLYRALLNSIKAHAAARDIIKEAVVKMDEIMTSFPFTDPKIEEAATAYVERYRTSTRNSLGHMVGMAVHDVRGTPRETLEPGMVFTIEPAMRIEDILLITEDGCENLSGFVPIDIDAIEALMAQPGVSEGMLNPPAGLKR
jgi:Xaa-Pro aminopeptidase